MRNTVWFSVRVGLLVASLTVGCDGTTSNGDDAGSALADSGDAGTTSLRDGEVLADAPVFADVIAVTDLDRDDDGVPDDDDALPDDPTEVYDSDGDGVGNLADLDEDGDGSLDVEDRRPFDPATSDYRGQAEVEPNDVPREASAATAIPVRFTGTLDTLAGTSGDVDVLSVPIDEGGGVTFVLRGAGTERVSTTLQEGTARLLFPSFERVLADGSRAITVLVDDGPVLLILDDSGDLTGRAAWTVEAFRDDDLDGLDDERERAQGLRAPDPDTDDDGVSDFDEVAAPDVDGDALPTFLDLDSDGDGLSDGAESIEDDDEDGMPAFLDLDSDGIAPLDAAAGDASLNDLDADGRADYRDVDDDGDGLRDDSDPAPTVALRGTFDPATAIDVVYLETRIGTDRAPDAVVPGETLAIEGVGFGTTADTRVIFGVGSASPVTVVPDSMTATEILVRAPIGAQSSLRVIRGERASDVLPITVIDVARGGTAALRAELVLGHHDPLARREHRAVPRAPRGRRASHLVDARSARCDPGLRDERPDADRRSARREQHGDDAHPQRGARLRDHPGRHGGDVVAPGRLLVRRRRRARRGRHVSRAAADGAQRPHATEPRRGHHDRRARSGPRLRHRAELHDDGGSDDHRDRALDRAHRRPRADAAVLARRAAHAARGAPRDHRARSAHLHASREHGVPARCARRRDARRHRLCRGSDSARRRDRARRRDLSAAGAPIAPRHRAAHPRSDRDAARGQRRVGLPEGGDRPPHRRERHEPAAVGADHARAEGRDVGAPRHGDLRSQRDRWTERPADRLPREHTRLRGAWLPQRTHRGDHAGTGDAAAEHARVERDAVAAGAPRRARRNHLPTPGRRDRGDAGFTSAHFIHLVVQQNYAALLDARAAYDDGSVTAFLGAIANVLVRDFDNVGPITRGIARMIGRGVAETVVERIAERLAAKLVPVVGQLAAILEVGSMIASYTNVAKVAVDLATTPGVLGFDADFGFQLGSVTPGHLERAARAQSVTLMGTGLLARDASGTIARPTVEVRDLGAPHTRTITPDVNAEGTELRFSIPGDYLRAAAGPLTLTVSRAGESLEAAQRIEIEQLLRLATVTPETTGPKQRIVLEGGGFGARPEDAIVYFYAPSTGGGEIVVRGRIVAHSPTRLEVITHWMLENEMPWEVGVDVAGLSSNRLPLNARPFDLDSFTGTVWNIDAIRAACLGGSRQSYVMVFAPRTVAFGPFHPPMTWEGYVAGRFYTYPTEEGFRVSRGTDGTLNIVSFYFDGAVSLFFDGVLERTYLEVGPYDSRIIGTQTFPFTYLAGSGDGFPRAPVVSPDGSTIRWYVTTAPCRMPDIATMHR